MQVSGDSCQRNSLKTQSSQAAPAVDTQAARGTQSMASSHRPSFMLGASLLYVCNRCIASGKLGKC